MGFGGGVLGHGNCAGRGLAAISRGCGDGCGADSDALHLAALVNGCDVAVAAGPGNLLVGRVARGDSRRQLDGLALLDACRRRADGHAFNRYLLRNLLVQIDCRSVRVFQAGVRADVVIAELAALARDVIPVGRPRIGVAVVGAAVLEVPQQVLAIGLVVPELAGVAAGRLLVADPEAAAGGHVEVFPAVVQPCADRTAVAGLQLGREGRFGRVGGGERDRVARDSRGDTHEARAGAGAGRRVADDVDGAAVAAGDHVLGAVLERFGQDVRDVLARLLPAAAADGQVDDALAHVRAAGLVVLDVDVDGAFLEALHGERASTTSRDIDRGIALELGNAAAAERCGVVVAAVRRAVGHVDGKRLAHLDRDRLLWVIGGRGDADRLVWVFWRGAALADGQVDGSLSCVRASVRAVVLDGDVDCTLGKTLKCELTGTASCDVHGAAALDLGYAAVAERCREIVGAARRAVGRGDDKRIANVDGNRFFGIAGGGSNADRMFFRTARSCNINLDLRVLHSFRQSVGNA